MLALVTGDVLVHIAQFTFNHAQTVTDELRGTDGNLVLVLDPLLIIYLDQRIQDIFRLWDGYVINAEIDDSGILVTQIRTQSGGVIVGYGTYTTFIIADGSPNE